MVTRPAPHWTKVYCKPMLAAKHSPFREILQAMKPMLQALFLSSVVVLVSPAGAADLDAPHLYGEHCAGCHGDQGDGMTRARRGLNPPPRDFTSALAKAELTRDRMIQSVAHGRPDTAMMAFSERLTPPQIEAVVDYIRTAFLPKVDSEVSDEMRRLARGKAVYTSNCGVCHGDEGNGAMWTQTSLNPPPRDFTSAQAKQELSRERMLTSVTHGRPGTAMMSFNQRLSTPDIEAVVDYVRETFLGKAMTLAQTPANPHGPQAPSVTPEVVAADMSLPLPNNLLGDVEKGRAFYMSNCFTCHGRDGDGNGPRSSFIQPKPRNFLDDQSRQTLNRPALFKSIGIGKPGTVMPAWSKVLSDQQIADVAEFVFQHFVSRREDSEAAESQKKKAPG